MFSNNGTEKSLQNSLFLKNFLTRYFLTKKKIFTGIYPKDCYFSQTNAEKSSNKSVKGCYHSKLVSFSRIFLKISLTAKKSEFVTVEKKHA